MAPPLRGPAAPSKSSMLLALLMLVVGLLGGALGGPEPRLGFDTEWFRVGGVVRLSVEACGARLDAGRGGPEGGGTLDRPPGGGGVTSVGIGVPLTDRGIALGGGGVAFLASVFSAPDFLLIQRFSSGS